MRGHLADPQVSPGGAALVWVFDFSESESELSDLRSDAARAREDFAALVGLIEAAPMPMWFRGPDTQLRLVNSAYVKAVGATGAEAVIAKQIELIEAVDGLTAAQADSFFANPTTVRLNVSGSSRFVDYTLYSFGLRIVGD